MRCAVTTTAGRRSEPTVWDWCGDLEEPARAEGRGLAHRLDWFPVIYWLTLLACSSLFGLIVGGYKGYMDAATPAVDGPGILTNWATSDVQWTAMTRQCWATTHRPSDSVAENAPGSFCQHLTRSAATDTGVWCYEQGSASWTVGMHIVGPATSAGNGMQETVEIP